MSVHCYYTNNAAKKAMCSRSAALGIAKVKSRSKQKQQAALAAAASHIGIKKPSPV